MATANNATLIVVMPHACAAAAYAVQTGLSEAAAAGAEVMAANIWHGPEVKGLF